MSTDLINTEALRKLIREELRAMQVEGPEPAEKQSRDEELTAKQVAEMKGVKPRTVYDWVREGRIQHHYTPGGRLRFYRRHVEGVIHCAPNP